MSSLNLSTGFLSGKVLRINSFLCLSFAPSQLEDFVNSRKKQIQLEELSSIIKEKFN